MSANKVHTATGPIFFSVFLLIIGMISIQSGASLAKGLFPLLGPQITSTLRLFFASLILCIIWRPWKKRITKQQWQATFLYGAALGFMNLLFYMSLARIPLGIAVAFEFTGPLCMAFIASHRKWDFLWASLAVVGILLILPLTELSAPLDWWGVFYAVGAGFFWALYIYYGQKAGAMVHGGLATTLGMLSAFICVAPFGLWQWFFFSPSDSSHLSSLHTSHLGWSTLFLAVGVGVFSSALPYSLEMVALKRLPAQTFSILMSLEPAIAAGSGLIFLGEQLSFIQWVAISCIITASLGTSLQLLQKSKPSLSQTHS